MLPETEHRLRRGHPAVIGRKLALPPPADHVIKRPRLDALLGSLIDHYRIILVTATPGAGKTTAAATAASQCGRGVAWLTLDRTDTAPGRLLLYLEAALARVLPSVDGMAMRALAGGLPHAEAAGLLADAIGEERLVVVLDELERLENAPEAWSVLEAFLRYAPPSTCVLLLSRRDLPIGQLSFPAMHELAVLGEQHLAFTPSEAEAALEQLGHSGYSAEEVVAATGGWVTGVLFEAWRSSDHVAGMGGEADPLYGYLSSHMMAALAPEDREFLITTSLLDEVDAERASALGLERAGERLDAIRAAHLPVTWSSDGTVMRCHSRFREYFAARLARRGQDEIQALRLAYGRLLASEGAEEEAVEELLQAGAVAEALPLAERAIVRVIERLDVSIAERWLEALRDVASEGASALTTAELMLAIGREDLRQAVRIADQLTALGEREQLAAVSPHAALFMSWAYLHVGRSEDIRAIMEAAGPGPTTSAVQYVAEVLSALPRDESRVPPPLTGGPLDALISIAHYGRGRLTELTDESQSPWVKAVVAPYRTLAFSALGQTDRALELYETAGPGSSWRNWVGPDLLVALGRGDEARALIASGRAWAEASGSVGLRGWVELAEAKLALRVDHDPAAATRTLERLERLPDVRSVPVVAEMLDCWYGLALLQQGRDEEALERLRSAVEGMVGGDRLLELPTAAVYLADAWWRAGDDEAADRAADLALDAARRQGSTHVLIEALKDAPAVLTRRLDAEASADSPWHSIGRAFVAQGHELTATPRSHVHLVEFDRRAIIVDGGEVKPRLQKTYELLAYLVIQRPRQVGREELLQALFEGRSDSSTRAHLRQAMQWLRQLLPGDEPLVADKGGWQITASLGVTSDSVQLETELLQAARLSGEARLDASLSALRRYGRGDYLPGTRSAWADERDQIMADVVSAARLEAAEQAYAVGRLDAAGMLLREVLADDPHREVAWRLQMRVASAVGDEDAVIRAFYDCERALADIGACPSNTTQQLLDDLRR